MPFLSIAVNPSSLSIPNQRLMESLLSRDLEMESAALCLTVADIRDIEKLLTKLPPFSTEISSLSSHPFKKYDYPTPLTSLLPTTELFTYDPLGNLLMFSNKASPFGGFGEMNVLQPLEVSKSNEDEILDSKVGFSKIEETPGTFVPFEENDLQSQSIPSPKISLPTPQPVQRKKIGVLTSGGDSSGMNAAVRAITRYALQRQCLPFAIFEGYQGLVEGGSKIRKLNWEDVRGLLAVGGTVIGTGKQNFFLRNDSFHYFLEASVRNSEVTFMKKTN